MEVITLLDVDAENEELGVDVVKLGPDDDEGTGEVLSATTDGTDNDSETAGVGEDTVDVTIEDFGQKPKSMGDDLIEYV